MLLLRSAFWLTVAYVAIGQHGALPDVGALPGQAFAAGQQLIADQIGGSCTSPECRSGKAVLSVVFTSNPSSESTMQDSHSTVPIPRPRPPWMG